jgi:transcriptional regulator with XRE-family HTH domain
MKRDALDLLLQLAYLEGVISTRGLYERMAAAKSPAITATPESAQRLLRTLVTALEEKTRAKMPPQTVGSFLKEARGQARLRSAEISARLGIRPNIYRMLENDRISPLKLPPDAWKKLKDLFGVSGDALETMIRRTYLLVLYRPSFAATLARYDRRTKKGKKVAALHRGAEELFLRADLPLAPSDEAALAEYLDRLRERA